MNPKSEDADQRLATSGSHRSTTPKANAKQQRYREQNMVKIPMEPIQAFVQIYHRPVNQNPVNVYIPQEEISNSNYQVELNLSLCPNNLRLTQKDKPS